MNSKKDIKFLTALSLILAIALAPVSTAAFAQEETVDDATEVDKTNDEQTTVEQLDDTDKERMEEIRKLKAETIDELKQKREELKELRAEKIQEFKDRVKNEYKDRVRPHVITDRLADIAPDRKEDLTFSGRAGGWTLVGGHAYESFTQLEGKAWHVRGDIWKVHSKGTLEVGQRSVDVELKGFANGHRLTLHGSGFVGEDPIRVFIRGHYAPAQEYGVFAIAFNQMGFQNENTGAKLIMAQVGKVIVTPTGDIKIPEPLPYDEPVELFQ